jgi:hypothetical protein
MGLIKESMMQGDAMKCVAEEEWALLILNLPPRHAGSAAAPPCRAISDRRFFESLFARACPSLRENSVWSMLDVLVNFKTPVTTSYELDRSNVEPVSGCTRQ